MAITFEQFMYAIGGQESGGLSTSARYKVVNSYGAVGKYQVLKSNIPSWSKEILGYSISWQQFRDSPTLQEKIVQGKLRKYFNAWGPRGAAAAWYAGPGNHDLHMSTKSQPGGPSIKGYVDSVLSKAGGYTGAGGSGGGLGVATVTPTIDKYTLMEQYGLTAAMINSNKEIKNLFNKAVAGGWDEDLFTAKLKNTKWWRTTSDAARKFFMMKTGDPATWKQKRSEYAFKLNQLAVQVGLGNQITTKGKVTATLERAMGYAMRDGWDDARIKAWFGAQVKMQGGHMLGEAGEAYDQLFSMAYSNGLTFSTSWYQSHIRDVVAGKSTLEALQGSMRDLAVAKYSAFADQIRAGQSALDLAQPYIQSVANILELPSTDIDLANKWVNKAMTSKQGPGGPGTQYPLWQFENDLRSDPLWKQTNNAREGMFSVARQVAKDFGMAF